MPHLANIIASFDQLRVYFEHVLRRLVFNNVTLFSCERSQYVSRIDTFIIETPRNLEPFWIISKISFNVALLLNCLMVTFVDPLVIFPESELTLNFLTLYLLGVCMRVLSTIKLSSIFS